MARPRVRRWTALAAVALALVLGPVSGTSSFTTGESISEGPGTAATLYNLTFSEVGLKAGTLWWVSMGETNLSSTNDTITFEEPAGNYTLAGGTPSGRTAYLQSGDGPSGYPMDGIECTVPQCGSSGEVSFEPHYAVTFEAIGIVPASFMISYASYELGASGYTQSTGPLDVVNSSSVFQVIYASGLTPSPGSGSIMVHGSPFNQLILFTSASSAQPDAVTFSESGLPTSAPWSVSMDGYVQSSTQGDAVVYELPGVHSYAIGNAVDRVPTPSTGTLNVTGPVYQSVTFAESSQRLFAVTLRETGLPSGSYYWTATLNGSTQSSTSSVLSFSEINGTFPLEIPRDSGYWPDVSSENLTVANSSVEINITFEKPVTVTFVSQGLWPGSPWAVEFVGKTYYIRSTSISILEVNGSYPFSIPSCPGFVVSPTSGLVNISGMSVVVTIHFNQLFSVTFSESGLSNGTLWSITLAGQVLQATNSSIAVLRVNGNYSFSVGPVSGYSIFPRNSTVTVQGGAAWENITFTPVRTTLKGSPSGSPKPEGLPRESLGLLMFGGIAVTGAIAVVFVVRSYRHRYQR